MLLPELATMNSPSDLGFTDVTIPSDTAEARRVQDDIEKNLGSVRASDQEIFSVRLALEEALVNAIKHGNQMDPNKTVRITCRVATHKVRIEIEDQGEGFHPAEVPDPTADENLERPCGRGIMLMRAFMSSIAYNASGNCVILEKHRSDPSHENGESS